MSRLNMSDEEDFAGQFDLWNANRDRSLRGRRGQSALRELEAALLAWPSKRLESHLVCRNGEVCALGAVLVHRRSHEYENILHAVDAWERTIGMNQDDADSDDINAHLHFPRLVAWSVVYENDEANAYRYHRDGSPRTPETLEERYTRVLSWVQSQLRPVEGHIA
jgi:hypothetical protein